MTEAPIDLTNLREITGGNEDIEKMLLKEFISSSNKAIEELTESHKTKNYEEWKIAAHSLSGICLNLDATNLINLSKNAQLNPPDNTEERMEVLDKIVNEHNKITSYITNNLL